MQTTQNEPPGLPRRPSDVQALLDLATDALRKTPENFSRNGMAGLQKGEFSYEGEGRVVCRGLQNPSAARLIENTVAARDETNGAVGAVALLAPPQSLPKRAKLPKEEYVRRYQAAAWHGLGIIFLIDRKEPPVSQLWNPMPFEPGHTGDFDSLADEVDESLRTLRKDETIWIPMEDSRDAEGPVRIAMHRALSKHGFRRLLGKDGGKACQGFWRRAESDGVWIRSEGTPSRIALEVKYREDSSAPLCQIIDDLGHADAVINVRVADGKTTQYEAAFKSAMEAVQQRLPVRYVELPSPCRDESA